MVLGFGSLLLPRDEVHIRKLSPRPRRARTGSRPTAQEPLAVSVRFWLEAHRTGQHGGDGVEGGGGDGDADHGNGVIGFQSRATRCASAISSGVIWEAAKSRSLTTSGSFAAAKLSHMYARTTSCCTPWPFHARPFRRLGVVLLNALAVVIHAAEAELRAGIAMLSKRQTWLKSRRVVFPVISL